MTGPVESRRRRAAPHQAAHAGSGRNAWVVVLMALVLTGCTRGIPTIGTPGSQQVPKVLRQESEQAWPVAPVPAAPEWPPAYFRPLLGRLNVDPEHARDYLERALQLAAAEPDPVVKSRLLLLLIPYLVDVADRVTAGEAFSEAVALIQDRPAGLSEFLDDVGNVLDAVERRNLQDFGVSAVEQVLLMSRVAGDPRLTLPLYARLGRSYQRMRNIERFAATWNRAVQDDRLVSNPAAMQDLALSRARLRMYAEPEGAAEDYRLAIGTAGRDAGLLFRGLRRAIFLAMEIGRYQDAVDFGLIGLAMWRATSPEGEVMEFLADVAETMTQLGRFDLVADALAMARARLLQAAMARTAGTWMERLLLAEARLYALLGDGETSRRLLERMLPPKTGVGGSFVPSITPEVAFELGRIYRDLGDQLRADTWYRQCATPARGLTRRPIEIDCRFGLAQLLEEVGEGNDASRERATAVNALTSGELIEQWRWIMTGLLEPMARGARADWVGEVVRQQVSGIRGLPPTVPVLTYRAALEAMELAMLSESRTGGLDVAPLRHTLEQLFREPYVSVKEVDPIYWVGRILWRIGAHKDAFRVWWELVDRIEYARGLVEERTRDDPQLRALFTARIHGLFETITNAHLERGQPGDILAALAAREANRARAVADLTGRHAEQREEEPVLRDVYGAARARLERVRRRSAALGSRGEVEAAEEFFRLKLGLTRGQFPVGDTRVRSMNVPQRRPAPRLDLAAVQSKLEPSVAVLVYHLSDTLSGVWTINSSEVRWTRLASTERIRATIRKFRDGLKLPHAAVVNWREAAAAAYQALIAPVASQVDGKTRLVIVPDDELFDVPLEGTVVGDSDTGAFLMERYEVSYALSLGPVRARTNARPTAEPGSGKLLLLGDPILPRGETLVCGERQELRGLPAVHEEMNAIQRIVGSGRTESYSGQTLRVDRLPSDLRGFRMIHVATHGLFNWRAPWRSCLVFSGGDAAGVPLSALARLRLDADLVVLSACETGRGRVMRGEGLWGFPSAALAAGARNVVGSLWRVEDRSTARLMEEFYRAMAPDFREYRGALRIARLRLLRETEWKHPYYWAPFVLYGGL